MKYGIPVTKGVLDPHFGHCESFALIDVDVEKKTVTNQQIVASPGHQPGALPVWLAEKGVNVVIAGGMGGRAIDLFTERGVTVVMGAKAMDPQKAVLEHLKGTLVSSGSACHEHEHGCQ
ncbi:MAG: NifB/NifX family molybdenum-iron cluster-binding protein [Dehalococcoidia bacterium]|nr:NifB/NifX family molybdenum-iron cluster-binding protein [Dehalococcoidia bacterium]